MNTTWSTLGQLQKDHHCGWFHIYKQSQSVVPLTGLWRVTGIWSPRIWQRGMVKRVVVWMIKSKRGEWQSTSEVCPVYKERPIVQLQDYAEIMSILRVWNGPPNVLLADDGPQHWYWHYVVIVVQSLSNESSSILSIITYHSIIST